jgi:hypothetical protein
MTSPASIRRCGKGMAVTNALAYYDTELITAVKSFTVQIIFCVCVDLWCVVWESNDATTLGIMTLGITALREALYQMGDNLKVVWAEFSTLSLAVLQNCIESVWHVNSHLIRKGLFPE